MWITPSLKGAFNIFKCFFGVLECVGHSFAYVAHFVFLRYVWIRTQNFCRSKQAPYQLSHPSPKLATHLPKLATHASPFNIEQFVTSKPCTLLTCTHGYMSTVRKHLRCHPMPLYMPRLAILTSFQP
jgi:hypothetical protein